MKYFFAIFLLVLAGCERKELTALEFRIAELQTKVAQVSQQRDLLLQKLETLKDTNP